VSVELNYCVIKRGQIVKTGSGKTVDLSSIGVSFESRHTLPPGANIELELSWPAVNGNGSSIKLSAAGTIIRGEGCLMVARMSQPEFRTTAN
jgi:hypothetical protein